MSMIRINNRQENQMRPIEIEIGVNKHAEGSALVKFGDTHVICTATIENGVPRWMRGSNEGWITAEYGMLPRSTHSRMNRESARGKQSGRTMEIQRLIGRSLRQAVSIGLKDGEPLLDLNYEEDSSAETDLNVVMTESGGIIEVQGTAEIHPFTKEQLDQMLAIASDGIKDIIEIQKSCLS